MPVDAHTRLITLLGYPVSHSLSPLIHNTAFRHDGLNLCYVATPVRPADLPRAVDGLRALQFVGANVTLPHKQAVLPLLDTVSAEARAVGAVNTIVQRTTGQDASLHGDNTDVAGFLTPLQPHLEALPGTTALVLGAGGAARAAVYALLTHLRPATLYLAVRRPEAGAALARDLAAFDTRSALTVVPLSEAQDALRRSRLVVNATPVGMHPHAAQTPWPAAAFTPDHLVYDLIYNPPHTRLLHDAARQGAKTLGGLPMFIGQAAAAYRHWTHRPLPEAPVRAALAAHFANPTP